MGTEDSKILENYLKSVETPDLESFLDHVCEGMFMAYIVRSLHETRKQYIIRQLKQREKELLEDTPIHTDSIYQCDVYELFFENMLDHLTKRQKICMQMSFRDGKTNKEIAEFLNVTPQAVHKLIKNGLKKLKGEYRNGAETDIVQKKDER